MNASSSRESAGSKAGVHYVTANDGRIPHKDERNLRFDTPEGNDEDLTVQVAEVNRALGAVSHLVDKGYKVTFDKHMSTDKSAGVTSRSRRERNVWVLDAFVNVDGQSKASRANQDFPRRVRA